MRRVALIYNPASGQQSARRATVIANALAMLRGAGVQGDGFETSEPGSALTLAKEAVRQGYDTILACGGDGTANEILQCLVGTQVALGVVPLGTANALAADLGLGSSPLKAVQLLLSAAPVEIPVGRIFYQDVKGVQTSRYFTVAAGVGADALCIARLDAGLKRRFGYALYMMEMFRVWATHTFPLFDAVFVPSDGGDPRLEKVSQILVVRIRNFGGMLHNLAPGASLCNNSIRLLAFKTRSRFHYLRFVLASLLGRQTFNHRIELLDVQSVECRASNGDADRVYVEADGELLDGLPVKIEIAPQTLTLLIPPGVQP
jgi:diacylglycerol kinase family enzyme